jgi:predicted peptidase
MEQVKEEHMHIIDNLKTVEFTSRYDESSRQLLLSLPLDFHEDKPYPLVISPHPFGWSNFENFASGTPDLLQHFKGWTGISDNYKVVIALPYGHGKVHDKICLGFTAQIEDLISIPQILSQMHITINREKIYLCGLSMGGMETLTALGLYPGIFTAGISFNAIADLAGWYEDIVHHRTDGKLIDFGIDKLIVEELGGTPAECPEEYDKRSAINNIDNLAKTKLMIYWSSKESIVVNQERSQSKHLFDAVKRKYPHSHIYEKDHSYDHGFHSFNAEECIRCHEYSDFDLAVRWLLNF